MRLEDLRGKTFNKLTVIERAENKGKQTMWLCKCECGNNTIVSAGHLKNGHTQSCGCIQREIFRETVSTHKMTRTPIYRVWRGIIDRTLYPSNKSYKNYGARGITICEEWKNDFTSFYEWAMLNGYKSGLSIDRIDVNGNYEPNNCRWVSMKVQGNNRRNNRLLTYNGETHTMKEWSEIRGIKYSTLSMRIHSCKWSIGKSLNYVSEL